MKGPTRRHLAAVCLLALLGAAGCGRRLAFNDRVEGTVTMDGVPLAGVHVEFMPDLGPAAAPSSVAFTDAKGHYELSYGPDKPGAVVARHRVVVIPGRSGGNDPDQAPARPRPTGPAVPLVYAIAARTPLQVEVTPDRHTYDLELRRTGRLP